MRFICFNTPDTPPGVLRRCIARVYGEDMNEAGTPTRTQVLDVLTDRFPNEPQQYLEASADALLALWQPAA